MEEEILTKKERKLLKKQKKLEEREKIEVKSKTFKYFLIFVFLGLAVFGSVKFYSWITEPVPAVEEAVELSGDEWFKGKQDAKLTIVEYSDFQCPACAAYQAPLNQLLADYEDVKLVYRHFPLVSIHPNALAASKASEAAGKQGKFWEYHDVLFERQTEWGNERNPEQSFIGYAQELELDVEVFRTDMNSKEVEARVSRDIFAANRLRLNSTPTVFMNGDKIALPRNYEDLARIAEGYLK
jgi:protein-disulfide isomerase